MVEFSACSLSNEQAQTAEPGLSAELRAAFTQVGFVFLQNTGISQDEVGPEDAEKLYISAMKRDFLLRLKASFLTKTQLLALFFGVLLFALTSRTCWTLLDVFIF